MKADSLRLNCVARNHPAHIEHIDWTAMSAADGARLRELGLDEGASIELLHRAGWLKPGAHACRVGRMIVAISAAHAAAISVRPEPGAAETAAPAR